MICENCGKEHDGSFGSGRFCSKECANTRHHSDETKQKISESIKKETICYCQFCNKKFNNLTSLRNHEKLCKENPNRRHYDNGLHEKRLNSFVKINGDVLDITNRELEFYIKEHPTCEICGKTIDEAVKWDSKYRAKRLCVDHNHITKQFRGLLCPACNRQLGWFEKYENEIINYLNKK